MEKSYMWLVHNHFTHDVEISEFELSACFKSSQSA